MQNKTKGNTKKTKNMQDHETATSSNIFPSIV